MRKGFGHENWESQEEKVRKILKIEINWMYVKYVLKFQIFAFKVMILVHVGRNITNDLLQI
jgi:hypothetical protein